MGARTSGDSDYAWALGALAGLDDGVFVVDEQARLVYANEAAEHSLGSGGLGPDPAKWGDELGLYRPDATTRYTHDELPFTRALAGHPCRHFAIFLKNAAQPAGMHLRVACTPLRDHDGVMRGAAFFLRDASERTAREKALVEGESQRRAILDNILDMAWLKDREGRFVDINHRCLEMFGMTREQAIGSTDFDIVPRELAERFLADDAEVMRSAQQLRVEEQIIDVHGIAHWVETIKAPVFNANGDVIGTTGTARDITERRNAAEALRTSNDELERRVEERTRALEAAQETLVRQERLVMLGQLAGGIAHQIRNPLASISNATYVLKRQLAPGTAGDAADAIRIIHDEVHQANVIITGLLDFARVRAPDRQPTLIAELIERVLTIDTVPASIRVESAIEPVPSLSVDAEQIYGAIYNVVRNAVEAMPGGGVLSIEVAKRDGDVVIAIADTGQGISPALRKHLFEPLHSTKPLGVGLGLVTARTLVEAHGGAIVYVDKGAGARFEIRLPLT